MKELRPKIHFAPRKGWMNDPNGPVFYNGEYHIFFQHDPDTLYWNMMHWGHAVSRDLIYWEELPIALFPDEEGAVFSGSAFVDEENISGFGTEDSSALLLFYTSHNMDTAREEQCLAYTVDGKTFHKYENNPIIAGQDHTPARDPQVFRNKILGGYSLCITVESAIEFYHSEDFVNWEKTGEFRVPDYGLQGMIECPCMFEAEKYVLMMSMDVPESEYVKFPEGTKPHYRMMQYFVGTFDGRNFIADDEQQEALLMDHGQDFYAGTIFANTEETILLAWLGDFSEGAKNTPTEKEGFKGILSYPRKLTLRMTEKGYRLCHEFWPAPTEERVGSVGAEAGFKYEKTEDGELLTDGCVSEKILKDGLIAVTSYINE
jgi:fructan beta-fructosidase